MGMQINTSSTGASDALRKLAAVQGGPAQPTVARSSGTRSSTPEPTALLDTVESNGRAAAVATENRVAAASTLRDSDLAAKMVEQTSTKILAEPGIAVSAQANQANSNVAQLLEPARAE